MIQKYNLLYWVPLRKIPTGYGPQPPVQRLTRDASFTLISFLLHYLIMSIGSVLGQHDIIRRTGMTGSTQDQSAHLLSVQTTRALLKELPRE